MRKVLSVFLCTLGSLLIGLAVFFVIQPQEWSSIIFSICLGLGGFVTVLSGVQVWRNEKIKDVLRDLFELFFIRL